jgi:tetratricopeptide (TPR) repeat protein
MRRWLAFALLAFLLFAPTAVAIAQDVDDSAGDDYGDGCVGPGFPAQAMIETCSKIIESGTLEPADLAQHLTSRAAAYEGMNDFGHALADLDRAIAVAPDDLDAHRDRAFLHLKRKESAAAVSDMDIVVRQRPDDPWSYAHRGWARMMNRDYDAALVDLDHAIAMNRPGSWWAHFARGKVSLLLGRVDDALLDYDSAVALAPENARILLDRGIARFIGGTASSRRDDLLLDLEDISGGDFSLVQGSSAPTSLYAQLWAFATARRPVQKIDLQLAKAMFARLDLHTWPGPILAFYAGETDETALTNAVETGEPDVEQRRCESTFFIGMLKLRNQANDGARVLLSQAMDICPEYTGESLVAKVMLARAAP